ncbi:MAG: peptidase U35, partial [Gemmobacter sp.]
DFGAMFTLSNKAIYNDDLGMFDQIGKKMVAGATERFRRVLLEPVLANGGLGHTMRDGKAVFHADHGNLAAAGAVLDVTSLSAARLALRSQRGL